MLGKEARRRNRFVELRQFLTRFCPTLDRPRQRFFRQAVLGTVHSGSLIVSRWVRFIGGCKEPFYVQKRLLNNLKSSHWDDQKAWSAYQSAWGQKVEPDTPAIIDLCDLAKPRARRMKYPALVRDGSEDKLVYGYWCMEIYASWGKGAITPLLLDPYSIDDPATISENARIMRGVRQVMEVTQGRGVLVMDAGGERDNLLIPWLDDDRRFVVRRKGGSSSAAGGRHADRGEAAGRTAAVRIGPSARLAQGVPAGASPAGDVAGLQDDPRPGQAADAAGHAGAREPGRRQDRAGVLPQTLEV